MPGKVQQKAAAACSYSSHQREEYGRLFENADSTKRVGGFIFFYWYSPALAQSAMGNTRYAQVTRGWTLWKVNIYELHVGLVVCRYNPVSARIICLRPSSTAHPSDLNYTCALDFLPFKFAVEIVTPNASPHCSRCLHGTSLSRRLF